MGALIGDGERDHERNGGRAQSCDQAAPARRKQFFRGCQQVLFAQLRHGLLGQIVGDLRIEGAAHFFGHAGQSYRPAASIPGCARYGIQSKHRLALLVGEDSRSIGELIYDESLWIYSLHLHGGLTFQANSLWLYKSSYVGTTLVHSTRVIYKSFVIIGPRVISDPALTRFFLWAEIKWPKTTVESLPGVWAVAAEEEAAEEEEAAAGADLAASAA